MPQEDALRRALEGVGSLEGLDEAGREAVRAEYEAALGALGDLASWRERKASLEAELAGAEAELAEGRRRLSEPPAEPPRLEGLSLEALEQGLASAEAGLPALERALADLEQRLTARAERRATLPEQLADVERRLEEVEGQLAQPPPDGASAAFVEARRARLLAERAALLAQRETLRLEQDNLDRLGELLAVRRDLAERALDEARRAAEAWREAADCERRAEAERQAAEARESLVEGDHRSEAAREIARVTAELAAERAELAGKLEELAETLARTAEDERWVRETFEDAQRREKAAGLTEAVGQLLRQRKSELPDPVALERRAAPWRAERTRVQLRLIELDALRRTLLDQRTLEARVREEVEESEVDAALAELREQAARQREILRSLIDDYERYFAQLVTLDTRDRTLRREVREFGAFIDERVLWIRSVSPAWRVDPARAWLELRDLLSPSAWLALWSALLADLAGSPTRSRSRH